MRMASVAQGRDQQRLDRVQAVLGLLEGEVGLRFEHFVRDLDPVLDAVGLWPICLPIVVSMSW